MEQKDCQDACWFEGQAAGVIDARRDVTTTACAGQARPAGTTTSCTLIVGFIAASILSIRPDAICTHGARCNFGRDCGVGHFVVSIASWVDFAPIWLPTFLLANCFFLATREATGPREANSTARPRTSHGRPQRPPQGPPRCQCSDAAPCGRVARCPTL